MNGKSSVRYEIVIVLVTIALVFLLARVAHCQVTWSGPRQTPAQAAAVLRDCSACLSNVANLPAPLPEGPTVVILSGSPTAGPFGAITTPQLPVHPPCCFPPFLGFYRSTYPVYRPPFVQSQRRR